jgi:catechol 2,3-dioxygenase-like lactoylglutathione lyase family enzyme
MRLDHVAYRTADRRKTADFFIKVFGYRIQQEFTINFDDGHTAQCIALEPPEKSQVKTVPWIGQDVHYYMEGNDLREVLQEYHMPPEIFVSDGSPGSIVGEWVKARGGIGGIHHMAYQVDDVEKTMQEWRDKGYAEFSSEAIKCPGLTQVFSKPSELTGVIYELIKREEFGFCKDSVKSLMESTKDQTGEKSPV